MTTRPTTEQPEVPANVLRQEGDRLICTAHGQVARGEAEYLERMREFHVADGHARWSWYQGTQPASSPAPATWWCSICGVSQAAEQDYCHEARPGLAEELDALEAAAEEAHAAALAELDRVRALRERSERPNPYQGWWPGELGADERRALERRTQTSPSGCPDCGLDPDPWGGNPECPTCAAEPARCAVCEGPVGPADERAEVVRSGEPGGEHRLAHVECYLAAREGWDLA